MNAPLGVLTSKSSLSSSYRHLAALADSACDHAHCMRSNFPVGSAILAEHPSGERRFFGGSNVENEAFSATICAERNAATTAVHAGFTRFIAIALLLRKFPGGTPCGLCRDVLRHFDADTDVLNICDRDGNVRLFKAKELLPAPQGEVIAYKNMDPALRVLVNNAVASSLRSYVPYSKQHRGAIMLASRLDGHRRSFRGMNIDNASYGGSSCAEQSAAFAARIAGYTQNPLVVVAGSDPITGESLQVLREFGLGLRIGVVQPDKSVIMTTVDQLFPDSFGPDALE